MYTIALESVPVALSGVATAAGTAALALSDIGGDFSGLRFYRRKPRGWRRHVRRLKAAGQPVPLLVRRWSQRAAKRQRQHVARRVRAAAAEALRGMIDRAVCFGLEAR